MIKIIKNILLNTKNAYKESIVDDNEKLQDLLLAVLTDVKKLEEIYEDEKMNLHSNDKISKNNRYTYKQVKDITKIQLELARDLIPTEVAKREILKVVDSFPVHNLSQYNKRMKDALTGIGKYGFAYPSNWAKALIEETNYDKLVIQALKEQQKLYLEKDGEANKRIEKLLENL